MEYDIPNLNSLDRTNAELQVLQCVERRKDLNSFGLEIILIYICSDHFDIFLGNKYYVFIGNVSFKSNEYMVEQASQSLQNCTRMLV